MVISLKIDNFQLGGSGALFTSHCVVLTFL